MLLGSVLGLWPFDRRPTEKILEKRSSVQLRAYADQRGIAHAEGVEGPGLVRHILDRWDERTGPKYTAGEVIGAVILLSAGFMTTVGLGRLGGGSEEGRAPT
jgi:hypothetical protein